MRNAMLAWFWLLLAPIGSSQVKPDQIEDAGLAPRHCWTTAGGSASRSGAALGDPIAGPVEVAWRFPKSEPLKGAIEGEPLVWDNRVLISVRESDERTTLHILDLLDGKPTARTASFQTKMPLEPVIWNGVVVLRSAPNKIEAWRLRGKDFEKMPWFFQSKSTLSAPAMIGREIYVRSGASLVRLALGRTAPVWEKTGQFRGSPSVRGNHVYALRYSADGMGKLAWFRRSDGEFYGDIQAGQHDGGSIPPEDAEVRIAVLPSLVCVHHAVPVLTDASPMNATVFRRLVGPDKSVKLELLGILPLSQGGGAAPFGTGFAARIDDGAGPRLISFQKGLSEGYGLADRKLFTEFVDAPPHSTCGGVALFGARAVDETSRRILWSAELPTRTRAVPARGCVLIVESGARLCALRTAHDAKARARLLPAAAESRAGEAVALGETVAVLRDGTIVEGKLCLDTRRALLVRDGGTKPQTWQLDDVLLVEDPGRRLVYAGADDAAVRGIALLAERGSGDAYATLAVEADKAQDTDLVERLIGEAWARGATTKDLVRAEAKLKERMAQKSTPREDDVRKILEKEKVILADTVKAIWDRFQALPPGASWELKSDLLSAILIREPGHREARFAIQDELPAGVQAPDPFEAEEWLDFIDAVRQAPIEVVPSPRSEDANPSHAQRELGAAQASWRKDLVAIQSKSLLIITPVRQPGRIARCLSGGELVCETLEKLFGSGAGKRDKRHPIRLMLYETQQEYETEGTRLGYATASHLAWTSGHYSPLEQVARMFLPKGKAGFDRVFDVYSHEMTHAWIEERCPLFCSADRGIGRRMAPGDWIVEGFATLIENFKFDLEARTSCIKNQATPLEIVANARSEDLLPWTTLYRATPAYMGSLDPRPAITVPSRWILGGGYILSKINLFYSQAGATCLYLYEAEGGKYRDRLIKYVGDHYAARRDQLEIRTAFGLEPADLGAHVVEYAKSVAAHVKPR